MRHETHFNFDSQWSYDKGIIKASTSGGLFDDQIVSSKTIKEEKIEGRKRPYFYGVERNPLSFNLPIYFDGNLSADKIREILRWLDNDDYRPFYMIDHPERIVYAMVVDDINSIHNGIKNGYMELQMRTDSPSTLSPFTLSEVYSFSTSYYSAIDDTDTVNTDTYTLDDTQTFSTSQEFISYTYDVDVTQESHPLDRIIEFENSGDFKCNPIVHIIKRGDGDITLQNFSNDTGDFKFTGLKDKEQIMVDCENKEVETSENTHRYDNFSKNYLSFVRGVNRIKVIGDCDIWFETEFEIY